MRPAVAVRAPALALAVLSAVVAALSARPLVRASEPPAVEAGRAAVVEKCLTCHSGARPKGGLDLSTRAKALAGGKGGPAVVPGRGAESPLYERAAAGEMPPRAPLSEASAAALKAWIDAGAPYPAEPLAARRAGPDWWSLRPVRRPDPPDPGPRDRTPLDSFLAARLREQGLAFAPDADRLPLIRRVTFGLTGLPPTPEEVEAFTRDGSDDAYEKVVDRLLAAPAYGEHWGRHWLDVVRFGESHGYEMNQPRPNAWPYRDYVIRAFNRDTPLPRFALEQLAGDTPEGRKPGSDADPLTQAATGFLVGGTHDQVGNATPEGTLQQRADDLDDMVTAASSAFLALTVNCARCHDHKFDPISQKDYYALTAVFSGVNHADRPVPAADTPRRRAELSAVEAELAEVAQAFDRLEPAADPARSTPARPAVQPARNVEKFPPVKALGVRFRVLATGDGTEPCVDELEAWTAGGPAPRNVALAANGGKASASSEFPGSDRHRTAHLNDGLPGNARSWIPNTPGQGWARVDWPEPVSIDRVTWGRDREGRYTDRLATRYEIEVHTGLGEGDWKLVANSADRATGPASVASETPERAALRAKEVALRQRRQGLLAPPTVYAGTFSQPASTHLLLRGDPTRKGEAVAPAAPASVGPPLALAADAPEAERRLALARWLGDPANPLPARVMVNRAWHYHFGQGLVTTPSDFGFNGTPPSHPDLLDWLASEYARQGFRLKPIHRLILLSTAYRQSTRAAGEVAERAFRVDRADRLLWRFPPRRLEAEPLRDALLAVSGRLDRTMGGPGYSPWEPVKNYVAEYVPRAVLGPDAFRRMVYQFKPRSRQDPTFGAFDCPDAALAAPRRTASTTPLQALNLLNSRFLNDRADDLAERLRREAGPDPAAQVARAFRLAFGRDPSEAERAAGSGLVAAHGLPALCRAVLNANEFLYLD